MNMVKMAMAVAGKILKAAIFIGVGVWAIYTPKSVNVSLFPEISTISPNDFDFQESNKKILIEIKPTDNGIKFKTPFGESITPIDNIILYTKPIYDIIEGKRVEGIIGSNDAKSAELKQLLALETKVEELILWIQASSWDINQPSNKKVLEHLMDALSEYSTNLHQMENKPLDLQNYLKSRDSTYPYDTLDAFLKNNDFSGVYKTINKKLKNGTND